MIHLARCATAFLGLLLWTHVVSDALELPTIVNPPNEAKDVPLEGFSIVLLFQEAVQSGEGEITLQSLNGNGAVNVPCSDSNVWSAYAAVAVLQELPANNSVSVLAPRSCFRDAQGNEMLQAFEGVGFSTIVKGGTPQALDIIPPVLVPPSTSTALMPHSPLNGAWVKVDENYVLQFTEAVQAGPSVLGMHISLPRLPDQDITMSTSGPQVIIDPQVPGRVTVVPPPATLWPGSSRKLYWEAAAFLDAAGNALPASISSSVYGSLDYRVFISSVLVSITMQDAGTTTAAPYTNLAIRFADPVEAASGSFLFCRLSASFSVCDENTADVAVLVLQSHFVGRTVIVNPPTNLAAGQWIVSLRSAEILNFDVTSVSSASFSVITSDDTAGPEVLAKAVDCNNNGIMDSCADFGAGSTLFIDGVTEVNESTPVPLAASFLLYFSEPVAISGAGMAFLESSESTDGTMSVPLEIGSFSRDCVVKMRPQLRSGRVYSLRLDHGTIIDTSPAGNPFVGTNFTFFTPLGAPARHPSDGAEDVARDTLIRFAFPDQTTLRPEPGHYLEVLELLSGTRLQISMEDSNQVLPRGSELLLIPNPPLQRGGSFLVVLPPKCLRLLAQQVSLSFRFLPEDTSWPEVVYAHPAAGSLFTTRDQVVLYVLFSKEVVPTNKAEVRLLANGVQATILDLNCSTAASPTTPCLELEADRRRATVLPGGSGSRGQAFASWATPGTEYVVEVQQGAFAAAAQWPEEQIPSRAFPLSFAVQADAAGPVLLELSPAQPRGRDSESAALLRFDEPVAPGSGVAQVVIRALPSAGTRPPRIVEITARGNASSSSIVLTFDSAVQAGSGTVGIYQDSSLLWQGNLPGDARILGPTVMLTVPVALVQGTQYSFQEVAPGALLSAFPLQNGDPITAFVNRTVFNLEPAASSLSYIWSNLDEYACLPAGGVLPDVQVYFNDNIQVPASGAPSVHASLHRCQPTDCPASPALWSLGPGQLALTVGSPELHGLTLGCSSLSSGEGSAAQPLVAGETYELRLSAGLVQAQGASASQSESPEVSLFFSVCAPRFDTPPSDLVRVYAGLPFAVSTAPGGGPRRFELQAPQSFVQDQLGNEPTEPLLEVFMHDSGAPYLDSTGTVPQNLLTAGPGANVVLSFSELVQAGAGDFELWQVGEASGPRVTIDVESLLGGDVNDAYSLIVGRQVCLSPSALLGEGSYYVKTSGLGVLRDVVGNPLNQLDTSAPLVEDPTGHASSTPYQFTVGSTDIGPPEVAFVAGYNITGGTTVTGYVLFTQAVGLNSGQISFEDCGLDFNCDNSFDNPLPFTGADITFGSKGGDLEGGMMRFVRSVPTVNRKYRVTVPPNFVVDTGVGSTFPGPSRKFSFLVDVGEVPPVSSDNVPPTVLSQSPANGSTLVARSSSIKIHFNEDVQAASGTVRLCSTAAVTVSSGVLHCASGSELLSVDITHLAFDPRVLTIDLPGNVMAGQEVHILIPEGAVVDMSPTQNSLAAIQGTQYMFRIADEDTEPPSMVYCSKPRLPGHELRLLFSEAVLVDAGVSLQDTVGQSPANVSYRLDGTEVIIKAAWVFGTTYRLSIPPNAYSDMAGNGLVGPNSLIIEFNITSDTLAPEYNATLSGLVRSHDAFLITFNEAMMTHSAGEVHIASRATTCAGQCDDWIVDMSLPAGGLPIASYIDVNTSTRHYASLVQPTSAMRQGRNYSLQVPELALSDLSGNSFSGLAELGTMNVEATVVQDWARFPPRVSFVDAGIMPDPSFFRDEIVIYFTEAVQQGTEFAALEPSNGGDNCGGPDVAGACPMHYVCTQPCSYSPAIKSVTLASMTINASRVSFPVPVLDGGFSALEAGKGYKVVVPVGAFMDLAGNPNVAFDGERELGYVFSVLRIYDTQGPSQVEAWPPNGATAVSPTTNLRITFNEVVQAGTGLIHVGPLSQRSEECNFLNVTVTCLLPGVLEAAVTYNVSYAAQAILDIAGNPVANPPTADGAEWTFRTADIDLTPPRLLRAEAASGGTQGVESSSVLLLSFSETVQAGEGLLGVVSCQDVACPWNDESIAQAVDVQAASAESELYYSGSSVIFAPTSFLERGQRYAVRTNSSGVFLDAAGLPLPLLESGGVFYVVPEDLQPPSLAYSEPPPNSGDNAPTTDIILYFNEPVQAVHGETRIHLSDGQTTASFKADNSEQHIGDVQISGPIVVLDPAVSMDYNATVNITIPSGVFADMNGNLLGLTEFNFTTTVPRLQLALGPGQASGFSPRMQMLFHQAGGQFLVYGGRQDTGAGGACLADLYHSLDGTSWSQMIPRTPHPAMADGLASAASAVDAAGCIWVIGGQCSSSLTGTNTMWRSCTAGMDWVPLDPPEVVPNYDQPAGQWPQTLQHHALAVAGSWQLVLVDGPRGIVWRALDANFTRVLQATSAAPFGRRAGPALLAALDGSVFLLGGQPCAPDVPEPQCTATAALSDVWRSIDAGGSWTALVSQGLPPASGALPRGYPDAALVLSGSLIVLDSVGTGQLLTSRSMPAPVTLDQVPLLLSPAAEEPNVPTMTVVRITFNEAVHLSPGAAGVAELVERTSGRRVQADAAAAGRSLVLTPRERLSPGLLYRVEAPNLVLLDDAGVSLSGLFSSQIYQFTTTYDTIPPQVVSAYPADMTVEPWSAVVLEMSEAVQAGSGSLGLTCAAGRNFTLDVNEAIIVGTKVFFEPGAWLSGGQTYTLNIPAGLLLDGVGNPLNTSAPGSFTFKVMSGPNSSAPDAYSGALLGLTLRPAANVTEPPSSDVRGTGPPELLWSQPPSGATDLPRRGVNLVLRYSRKVYLSMQHHFSILNDADEELLRVDWGLVYLVDEGLWLQLADVLEPMLSNGTLFKVSIPAGAVVDALGRPASKQELPFTTLADHPDSRPPALVLVDPPAGARGVLGGDRNISLWFSEPVEVSNGTVDILSDVGLRISVPVNSSACKILDRQLLVSLPSSALEPAGVSLYLRVTLGAVQDLSRGTGGGGANAFQGLDGIAHVFTAVAKDTASPTLVEVWPPSEATPEFRHPVTFTLKLLFNEQVQAGTEGVIELVPTYTTHTIQLPATSTEVTIQGNVAIVSLAQSLMPGEIYTLSVQPGTFQDASGNPSASSSSNHIFSTAPKLAFQPLTGSRSALGDRVSSGLLVDNINRIWIAGGMQATGVEANPDGYVTYSGTAADDVWVLALGDDVPCASAPLPPAEASCDAQCSGDPPTLGVETIQVRVWREPGLSGSPCIGSDGRTHSRLGDLVDEWTVPCRCPVCSSPPPLPAPDFMVNPTAMLTFVNISAANGTEPITCSEGYAPSSPFVCVVKNRYTGKWLVPQCLPAPCSTSPSLLGNQSTENVDPRCSQEAMTENPLPHGESCFLQCLPGYEATSNVTCMFGTFPGVDDGSDLGPDGMAPARCVRQGCELPEMEGGYVINCTSTPPLLGETCSVVCKPGWRFTPSAGGPHAGTRRGECQVNASADDTSPELLWLPTCERHSCGFPTLADPNAIFLDTISSVSLGARLLLGCRTGYRLAPSNHTHLECAVSNASLNESTPFWQGQVTCLPNSCPPPQDSFGVFSCSGYTFQDVCSLSCVDGYEVSFGNGLYTCRQDGLFQGMGSCEATVCGAPDWRQVANAVGFDGDCPGTLNHNEKCSVVCKIGFHSRGEFRCTYGMYSDTPVCQASGTSYQVLPSVNGTLRANLSSVSSNANASELATSRINASSLESALAAACNTTTDNVGVSFTLSDSKAQVLVQGRRLRTLLQRPVRRLTGSEVSKDLQLSMDWQVRSTSQAYESLILDIRNEDGYFRKQFVQSMEQATDLQMGNLVLERVRAVFDYLIMQTPSYAPVESESNAGLIVGIVIGIATLAAALIAVGLGIRKRRLMHM